MSFAVHISISPYSDIYYVQNTSRKYICLKISSIFAWRRKLGFGDYARYARRQWETKGMGSEEFLTRQGGVLRTKEAKEDWEERKGKKTTPEGSKFLTFSRPL